MYKAWSWNSCTLSCSVVSDSLWPLDCSPPGSSLCPWDSPGKNTGMGCHFLLQGIFLTQELSPCVLHWQVDSLPLSLGSPKLKSHKIKPFCFLQRVPVRSDPSCSTSVAKGTRKPSKQERNIRDLGNFLISLCMCVCKEVFTDLFDCQVLVAACGI